MPFASVSTACVYGPSILSVQIEVDIQPGLPVFEIIGLPDKRIEEARLRIKSAFKNSRIDFPLGKITVNLSPPYIRKHGTGFDLGVAVGILSALQKVPHLPSEVWVLGELSLDGTVKPVEHLLAILIEAVKTKRLGCLIPRSNSNEAAAIPESRVALVGSLSESISLLCSSPKYVCFPSNNKKSITTSIYLLDEVIGQEVAKRVLEIALSGGHNLLFSGPPGTGKTMLAKAAAELLPPLSREEDLEVTQLHSLAKHRRVGLLSERPFRQPHHSISAAGLFGGGVTAYPGEMSLAHKGIIFLDEFPEFNREVREMLREPLQEKQVRLFRQGQEFIYPADCLVIAAQNTCPCGLLGVTGQKCRCSAGDLLRYQRSLSEPLLDRFDLFTELEKVTFSEWRKPFSGSGEYLGEKLRERILSCRKLQHNRLGSFRTNSLLTRQELQKWAQLDDQSKIYLEKAAQTFYLSGRAIHRLQRVARTIADLEHREKISLEDVQEAVQYRRRVINL